MAWIEKKTQNNIFLKCNTVIWKNDIKNKKNIFNSVYKSLLPERSRITK